MNLVFGALLGDWFTFLIDAKIAWNAVLKGGVSTPRAPVKFDLMLKDNTARFCSTKLRFDPIFGEINHNIQIHGIVA